MLDDAAAAVALFGTGRDVGMGDVTGVVASARVSDGAAVAQRSNRDHTYSSIEDDI